MHIRCPHCHNRIEVVDDDRLNEVSCPSCGSAFNLVSGTGQTTRPMETRTLGHFELLEPLGVGHFGSVWKAHDKELDRIVAVKIPRRDDLTEAEADHFLREARAAAQLRHPNIVSVHEVGREGETIYIVSDYVQGANLREWLAGQKLTPREAAELCATIADALHDAHVAGVIHRDLKPENIMMDLAGEPHIMDFGLAKRESGEITMTRDGHVLGTPAYMSPEQARGEGHHADRRSDVYSLGVILFELLTGELPFRGELRMLIVQILRDDPPSPRKLNGRIPRDLETICLKCLEKDPGRRYASASDLSADLNLFLGERPILARPISRFARGWRWTRRHPARAGLMAATAIALSALVAAGVALGYQMRLRTANDSLESANDRLATANRTLSATNQELSVAKKALDEAYEKLDRIAYDERITLAQREFAAGDITQAGRRLEDCDAKYRGWEWEYLKLRFHEHELAKLEGHTERVNCVTFSPDGARLASASEDKTIRLWDVTTCKVLAKLEGHTDRVNHVMFSPDGAQLASASGDKTIRLWDAATGKIFATLEGHTGSVRHVTFSPDGARLASTSEDKTVRLWDAATGKVLATLEGHTGEVNHLTFSPDGARLASASEDNTIRLWDVATAKVLATLEGHTDGVNHVAFSHDGARLASAGSDKTVRLWDTVMGKEVAKLEGHVDSVSHVVFSPDGTRLASAGSRNQFGKGDNTVRLWETATGKEIATLGGHTGGVARVAFSVDGASLASASEDGTIRLWDAEAATSKELAKLEGHEGPVTCVEFSPDGVRLASASDDGTVRLWHVGTSKAVAKLEHADWVSHVAFSPDGALLASSCGHGGGFGSGSKPPYEIRLWDAKTGKELRRLHGHTHSVNHVAFSSDGGRLASGSSDNSVRLWDVRDGKLVAVLTGHTDQVEHVAFSPDGAHIASASVDKSIRLWTVRDGSPLRTLHGHTDSVRDVAFAPDGTRVASAGKDKTVRLWNTSTGTEIATLKGHTDAVVQVTFSPDGTRLASSNDGTARLWDGRDGKPLATMTDHQQVVGHLTFNPDGTQLASVGFSEVQLWDTRNGKHLATLIESALHVAFSPDGARLASASGQSVRLWNTVTHKEVAKLDGHTDGVSYVTFSPDGTRLASASYDNTVRLWFCDETPERREYRLRMWALDQALKAVPETPYALCVEPLTKRTARKWVGIEAHKYVGTPAVSRDGKWIAFDALPEGESLPHCIVVEPDGREIRKLCIGCTPHWSPDAKQVIFMREPRYHKGNDSGLFVIDRDGSGERRFGDGRWPTWSPDGKHIAFSKGGDTKNGGLAPGAKVFIASADGTGARYVADGDCPTWSPDGKKIACCELAGDRRVVIKIVTIETEEAVVVGNGWYRAQWSSDGKSLACNGYVDAERKKVGIIRLSAEPGHAPQALFPDFEGAHSPCHSADGKSMIFVGEPAKLRAAVK